MQIFKNFTYYSFQFYIITPLRSSSLNVTVKCYTYSYDMIMSTSWEYNKGQCQTMSMRDFFKHNFV